MTNKRDETAHWNQKGELSVQLQVGDWVSGWHHSPGKYKACLNEWRLANKRGDIES